MIFSKKIYYGWIIVFFSVILMALGYGMFINTAVMFVIPVCESLGFSRAQFTLRTSIITLTCAILMPFYGRLIQKINVKRVLVIGSVMLGLVSVGYSFSTKLWHFYAFALVNGLFINCISFLSIGVLINAWFKAKKGLATGLAFAGTGVGGAIFNPVISRMIELTGWEWTFRLMGIFATSVLLPIIIIFIKNKPEDMGLHPLANDKPEEKNSISISVSCSFSEAIRNVKFWLLTTAFFLIPSFASSSQNHSAPYLSDLGYATNYVAALVSLCMAVMIAGKILIGTIYDRFGAMSGGILISVFCLCCPVFAYFAYIPAVSMGYTLFLGMACSSVSIPMPILAVRYFGEKDFPAIFGFFNMVSYIAQAISIPALGLVYDLTGSYRPAWFVFFIFSVIITGCLIITEILGRKGAKGIGLTAD